MKISNINLKLLIPSFIIALIAIILIFTHSTYLVIDTVAHALTFHHELAGVFWVIVLICGCCYYINLGKTENIKGKELFIHFLGPIPDLIISMLSYGMMFNTAIIMLSGTYRQYFLEYEFIKDVSNTDLLIISIPMVCLLFWSITQVYKLGIAAYTYSASMADIKTIETKTFISQQSEK